MGDAKQNHLEPPDVPHVVSQLSLSLGFTLNLPRYQPSELREPGMASGRQSRSGENWGVRVRPEYG